ncbi:adenylate/guanylate cyclase domain-containing protein [Desulfobacterium sp. N47]|uniref:Guanylate cyclase domain-containing protein n=1 Tax=uncultured Desulfobacterium sp. TaxID=201089 RepID=E1YCK7_9BACT|nr:hypothetical protein N47_G36250 [uncultured Desulfobacterium sp.]
MPVDKETMENLSQVTRERDIYKLQVAKIQTGYEAKIKELSILKELGETLRLINDLDTRVFWENQLLVLKRSLSFENVTLVLFDHGNQLLDTVAMVGKQTVSEHRQTMEADATKKAFINKEPVVVTDNMVQIEAEAEESGGAILCLPILHNKNCIGILRFRRKETSGFDPNMIRFLSLVSDGIATGIILSRIYGQMIQEEKQRLNLSRFFSATVREKIIDTKENLRLGGERKYVTILFADLQGFTSLSEKIDHQTVVRILNLYFSCMTPIIFRHHGTLDKLMGDGMMAIFGAPLSRKDDPLRAVQTAIDMLQALNQFNEENRNKGWPTLTLTVGINSGEVVAGYIGSEDHMNYTVIGDAVNVAQRIQSVAGSNEILISGPVFNAIQAEMTNITDIIGLKKLPAQPLKGKEKEVEIYLVEVSKHK